jgi:hypothetical protein
MTTIERPLSTEERNALLAQRDALERHLAAALADDTRVSRSAALAMLSLPAFFAAVVVFNVVAGSRNAALAAGAGVLVFGAFAVWLALAPPASRRSRDAEIARLTATLEDGSVRVHDLVADAALVISLRGSGEPIGDVLRMGTEVIYVRRRTTRRVEPEALPNRHLRVVDAGAGGLLAVDALAERLEHVVPVALESEDELFAHLVGGELCALDLDFDELTRTLDGTSRPPYR